MFLLLVKTFISTLGAVAKAIPAKEESLKQTIAAAENIVALLKQQMGRSWLASSYKMRGQWMASLVSSGVLPGWLAQMFDSWKGSQVGLSKIEGGPFFDVEIFMPFSPIDNLRMDDLGNRQRQD